MTTRRTNKDAELAKAKEKAEQSEAQYRRLFENMNTGFVLFEVVQNDNGTPVDLIIIAANEEFENTTGLNLKDVEGEYLTKVLPGIEQDEADWIGTYSKVALTGDAIQFEQSSELLGSYYSVSAFQAGPKQCAVTFLDITEQKKAVAALQKSEERFRVAQEHSPDGFTILHPLRDEQNDIIDFIWVYQNQAIARINGTQGQYVIGKRILDLFPAHKGTEIFEAYKEVARTGESKTLEDVYVGEVLSEPTWLRIVITPMEEDIAILAQNVTQRKLTEESKTARMKRVNRQRKMIAESSFDETITNVDLKSALKTLTKKLAETMQVDRASVWQISEDRSLLKRMMLFDIHGDLNSQGSVLKTAEFPTYFDAIQQDSQIDASDALKDPRTKELAENYLIPLQISSLLDSVIQQDGHVLGILSVEHRGPIREWYPDEKSFLSAISSMVGQLFANAERKKAEEKLSHSHDLMKYVIEHNKSSVIILDKDLKYLYVSQRFLKEYRVKEKEIIGKHHYEIFPDIPEKWRKVHQKALNGITSRADEDTFIRSDGNFDWTSWECRPWYEADGSIGGIILYLEIITERKKREEEIKTLNRRLEILVESIQKLTSVQSLENMQDIVAESARKLIGADGATLVFKENDHCFYVNEDAIQPLWKGKKFPMDSCISGWAMINKETVVIEDVFSDPRIPKDVYEPTFVKSVAMVPVNTKEPIGAIGNYWKEKYTPTETEIQLLQTLADAAARSIENITLYKELEERVKKRTALLEASNKELEAFSYSVSHDLRAPLRHISGYVNLLNKQFNDKLPEQAQHYLHRISEASHHLGVLIDDLLQYSRTGRQELIKTELDMNVLVQEVIEQLKAGLEVRDINWDIQELPNVFGDYKQLGLVWTNLLDNAIKYTGNEKATRISVTFTEEVQEYVFCVSDNGVGFDMKYAHKLFGVFQRLHSQTEFEGTGIGLANVQRIIHKHSGRVWAEAEPGKGAKFYFTLPK